MQQACAHCGSAFEITPEDLALLAKLSPVIGGKTYSIPPPTLCPSCRQQRRYSFRNERSLYHRTCDLTGKPIISMYSSDKAVPVYDHRVWWGDGWDALRYGRDFDISRPFFDQFGELLERVPRISLMNKDPENSEYCNFALGNKNCYLCFTTGRTEDGLYGNRTWDSRSVCDCSNIADCELCFEVIDSDRCYNCQHLQNCSGCSDCFLGYDLQGCRDCFGCIGLRNVQYAVANVQLSRAEYEKQVQQLRTDLPVARADFEHRLLAHPRKHLEGANTEHCTGNAITNAKNAIHCFYVKNIEDCRYVCNATNVRDIMDVDNEDHSELVYESIGSETNAAHAFNDICWFDRNILYCSLCFNSRHCFGCVGLRHAKYCILNKQYTKEEYEVLVPKLIAQMQQFGEWGEFFPTRLSPYGYNETVAQDFYPLTTQETAARGWKWHDEESTEKPDRKAANDVRICEATGAPFRIVPQERAFYERMGIPLPHFSPNERHRQRMQRRNPQRLWERTCMKCGKAIETSYAPERPEIVYCETCYLREVY